MKKAKEEKLKKIIDLERKMGFKNKAVMGGLGNLSGDLIEDEKISELLNCYGEEKPFKREQIIEELENYLKSGNQKVTPGDLNLNSPIEEAAGIDTKRGELFRNFGVSTIRDLIYFFPQRIEDRREVKEIAETTSGDTCTVVGEVVGVTRLTPQEDLELVKAEIKDKTGAIYALWFNQPWIEHQLKHESKVALWGEVKKEFGEKRLREPAWEPLEEKNKTRSLVPIYAVSDKLDQKVVRWILEKNLEASIPAIQQFPSSSVIEKYGFWERRFALKKVHQPKEPGDFEKARRSLSFSELFLFYSKLESKEKRIVEDSQVHINQEKLGEFEKHLPSSFTSDQAKTIEQIAVDLQSSKPMKALLQGEVGTGKTIVIATAAYLVVSAGYQVAIAAPNSMLADRHFCTLHPIFSSLSITIELLTENSTEDEREAICSKLKSGKIDILIGTHSLFQDTISFQRLNLAMIEEEQQFGMGQKYQLKSNDNPVNKLVLTSAPMPRAIAATLYGQFKVATLEDPYQDKKNVRTYWVSKSRRKQVYKYLAKKMKRGEQAFILLPVAERSENNDLQSLKELKEELAQKHLSDFNLGLLQEKMSLNEKKKRLESLGNGSLDALISTSIFKIGMAQSPDVNLLIIEEADKFSLAQLYRVRGEIGVFGQESSCFAIASPHTSQDRIKLEAFRDISDGFQLMERDLEIRGLSDFGNLTKNGFHTRFRACDFLKDFDIMKKAKREAEARNIDKQFQGNIDTVFKNYFGCDISDFTDNNF